MPGDLRKSARGFVAAPQGRVVLPVSLLVLNGTDEPARDVAFGGRLDQGVALLWTVMSSCSMS